MQDKRDEKEVPRIMKICTQGVSCPDVAEFIPTTLTKSNRCRNQRWRYFSWHTLIDSVVSLRRSLLIAWVRRREHLMVTLLGGTDFSGYGDTLVTV